MTRFEINGTIYESNEKGNYFYKSTGSFDKKGNAVMMRISRSVFEKAFDEYTQTAKDNADADAWQAEADKELEGRKEAQAKKDAETEKAFKKETTKKASKPRKSRDVAFELEYKDNDEMKKVTLTNKQVQFITEMPNDDFYERGLDSCLWIDVYCDTLAGTFNQMAVGAMVSTLREKNLIYIGQDKVNGKKAKFFGFTELGKEVAKGLGLK